MRVVAISIALGVAAMTGAPAWLSDTVARTDYRYGQPVAEDAVPGNQASTRTYQASGLVITCGYVAGKVEMESYSRNDRDFNKPEVEALLRSNGSKRLSWVLPKDGYVNGTYTRSDGATADLTGTKLTLQTPVWSQALAHDQAAAKNKSQATAVGGAASAANPNYSLGSSTNAAGYVESPAGTNSVPTSGNPAPITNAP
jgi:hypothetical protein